MIKTNLLKLAYWIFKRYEVSFILRPDTLLQDTVGMMVSQVEDKFSKESGEFKRAQVMRAVMNILPDASERDIAFAIELEIRRNV